ncbi:hypothetical protein, conserved [Plasmodium vivax]|uniref:Uncharacterized protein n=4 Tax=Plasmodium vivax TaxID=5855 RepID=A5K030_PLAVS|nr:hypothetical protein, conserved [Plasmodium vivax]EDL47591.1 hypothetical protein, conserved [Plasmodium vivax]KMZ84483.1 hypothetical protein PVBG_00263 [Plasmodium vivax Brazil I]KMZ90262.1 hypothetical protein PVMG_01629 [Plasmodium vivax Mauritania I]KMZ96802.1 hypothetical protein PVNG_03972 [Plasmodium vivax North Korean]|eukprot:XP_001617318.1 hypothetical protein [Plasmodium vivax Sal-1]
MISLATGILHCTYGRNLGNFLFNTFLFFANYLNCVCLVLKKRQQLRLASTTHAFSPQISCLFDRTNYREIFSLCNIKRANLSGLQMENKNLSLLNIATINNVEVSNKSLLEGETEMDERMSTELEDFYDDEYNFDFIDMVQQNDLDE